MMFKYLYKVLAKAENEAYNSAISRKYAKRRRNNVSVYRRLPDRNP